MFIDLSFRRATNFLYNAGEVNLLIFDLRLIQNVEKKTTASTIWIGVREIEETKTTVVREMIRSSIANIKSK